MKNTEWKSGIVSFAYGRPAVCIAKMLTLALHSLYCFMYGLHDLL